MPSLDQSVARQVGLVLSKIFTPFAISVAITVLDSSIDQGYRSNEMEQLV